MARIRTIKPEFFTSEDVVALSPLARLLFIALWCEADREGRLVWRPKTFKMRYLPADDADIEALCQELVTVGVVVCYGAGLAHIPSFKDHQHLNPRESESKIDPPDAPSKPRKPRVPTRADASNLDEDAQGGREGKEGREHASRVASAFDAFWSAWPANERKQDKAKCAEKLKAHTGAIEAILADIEAKKLSAKWQGGYIEAPEVYINNRRWEDGTEAPSAVKAGFI